MSRVTQEMTHIIRNLDGYAYVKQAKQAGIWELHIQYCTARSAFKFKLQTEIK
jgi:uncharacterized membrane protein